MACQIYVGLIHHQDSGENNINTYILHQCIVRFSVTTTGMDVANISRFGRLSKLVLLIIKRKYSS